MWNLLDVFRPPPSISDDEFRRRREELLAQTPIPCLWLLGKTGSGKTSIIRYLTGAPDAVIGNGFRPQTRCSRLFSFPDDELPIVRFLDTRGFGEAGYEPSADLAALDKQAQLVIVTVRATDQAAEAIVAPLREIRRANPQRPVLLAITCLHDAYPGQQHPSDTNGDRTGDEKGGDKQRSGVASDVPETLRKCLDAHYARFAGLYDRTVSIDLTGPDDGFDPPDLGGQQLKQAILDLLPAAYRQTLLQMDELRGALGEMHQRRALPIILGHSALAATAAAVPVPWVDIPVVMAIQSRLIQQLARLYNQQIDAKTISQAGFALGGRIALRMALREALKFIPWVGMAANAAAAFGFVYASGRAWNWYFQRVSQGHVPTAAELESIYQEQLLKGAKLWKSTHEEPAS